MPAGSWLMRPRFDKQSHCRDLVSQMRAMPRNKWRFRKRYTVPGPYPKSLPERNSALQLRLAADSSVDHNPRILRATGTTFPDTTTPKERKCFHDADATMLTASSPEIGAEVGGGAFFVSGVSASLSFFALRLMYRRVLFWDLRAAAEYASGDG